MLISFKTERATKKLSLFCSDSSGGIGMIFGLALVPLMLMVGLAVDYQRAVTARTIVQGAVDAAAIAVAQQPTLTQTQRQTIATNIVNANLGSLAKLNNLSVVETEPATNAFHVTASGVLPTALGQIAHISNIPISAQASSTMSSSGSGGSRAGLGCVLSLDDTLADSFEEQGSVNVNLGNCDLYDNSNSNSAALDMQGSALLTARLVSVTGGIHGSSHITGVLAPMTGTRVADPYLNVALPTVGSCAQTNYSTTRSATLSPGVYCGGMDVKSQAVITLNPGVYIIAGGVFNVNGQATIQTNAAATGDKGVTLVFTSLTSNGSTSWPTAHINGGAVINLSAPTSASSAMNGIVVYGDRNMPVGTSYILNGGSTQTFDGAVYLPKAALSYIGGATTTGCTQIIADTINFNGNSSLALNCTAYTGVVPFGTAIPKAALSQ